MTLQTTSDWWTRSVRGEPQPVRPDQVQCGYFMSKSQSGLMLPSRIWKQPGFGYQCTVGGETRDALKEWPMLARRPISAEAYALMMANLKTNFATPKDARKARILDLPPALGMKK